MCREEVAVGFLSASPSPRPSPIEGEGAVARDRAAGALEVGRHPLTGRECRCPISESCECAAGIEAVGRRCPLEIAERHVDLLLDHRTVLTPLGH